MTCRILVIFAIAFLFVFAVAYLCGAYVSLDLDPRDWNLKARAMQVYVALVGAGAIAAAVGLR